MDYKLLEDNVKIPVIGLGTWGIGGFMEADYSHDSEAIQSIKNAIAMGYTHIDTAELYGAGHTEQLIGQAIQDLDRSKLIITSKVYKTNLRYEDVLASCNKSLDRLHTDYIDIYLIHAPNPEIPLAGTMRAMDELVVQGKVKYVGVSNFSVAQMREAQEHSRYHIVANQIPYNLATRNKCHISSCINMESEIIPYCRNNDLVVMSYRPIERGVLLTPNALLDDIAKRYDKTRAQIALNWLVTKANVITICKSTNQDHLRENLGAIGWSLSPTDIELLDGATFEIPH